jgi:hypothetical protein
MKIARTSQVRAIFVLPADENTVRALHIRSVMPVSFVFKDRMLAGLRNFVVSIIIGVLFVLVGGFTLFGINTADAQYNDLEKHGMEVSGRVSSLSRETERTGTGTNRKTTVYEKATISYVVDSKTYAIFDRNPVSQIKEKTAHIGNPVTVLADKENPRKAVMQREAGEDPSGWAKAVSTIFISLGGLLLGSAGLSFLRGIVFP